MLHNQKSVHSQIAGTNDRIYKSVDMRKKQVASNLQKNLNLEEQKKTKVIQDKKNEQVKIIIMIKYKLANDY